MKNVFENMSVKKKIIVLLSVVFIVAMLSMGIVLDKIIAEKTQEDFIAATRREVEQVDNAIVLFLSNLKDNLKMIASNPTLKQAGNITVYTNAVSPDGSDMIPMEPLKKGGFEAEVYKIFEQFGESHQGVVSVVSYGTTDGGYLQWPAVPRKKGYDARMRDWYQDSMAEKDKIRITEPFMTSKGTPTIGIFSVVSTDQQQPLGVLGLNVDLPIITDIISDIKLGW